MKHHQCLLLLCLVGIAATASSNSTGCMRGNSPGQCGVGGKRCCSGLCCSKWGFCGTTSNHCLRSRGCQHGCNGDSEPESEESESTSPRRRYVPSWNRSPPTPSRRTEERREERDSKSSSLSCPGVRNPAVSAETFECVFKSRGPNNWKDFYCPLVEAAEEYGLDEENHPEEVAMFLAQVGHESAWLKEREEMCSKPNGQGWCANHYTRGSWCPNVGGSKKYFGRGMLQISWNCNYKLAGRALGLDLLNNPDVLAESPLQGWRASLWFWRDNCRSSARRGNFGGTTRGLNGALECGNTHKQKQRVSYYEHTSQCMNLPSPSGSLYC